MLFFLIAIPAFVIEDYTVQENIDVLKGSRVVQSTNTPMFVTSQRKEQYILLLLQIAKHKVF